MRPSLSKLLLLSAIGLIVGCDSGFVPVTGSVQWDGKPLKSGLVRFYAANGPTGYANVIDGKYAAKTGSHAGLKPGDYRVTVAAHSLETESNLASPQGLGTPPLITPARYSEPETSDLDVTVPPIGRVFDIALTSTD